MVEPTMNEERELGRLERRLVSEFGPRVGDEQVRRCLDTAVRAFDGARVRRFVPLLAERNVRARLRSNEPAPPERQAALLAG